MVNATMSSPTCRRLVQEERSPELVSSSVCVTQLEHREHDDSQEYRPQQAR